MSSPPSDAAAGRPALPVGTAARSFWPRVRTALGRSRASELLLDSAGLWDLGTGRQHDGLAQWCVAHPGRRCRLWLADESLSDLVCSPSAPLFSSAERLAWARRVLTHYHGREALQWPLAAWQWRGALGVSSVRAGPVAAWQAAARTGGVAVVSVRPFWIGWLSRLLHTRPTLRRARAADVLLFDMHTSPGVLTLVRLERGRPVAIARRRLGADVASSVEAALSPARNGPRVASVFGRGPAADGVAAAARAASAEVLADPSWPPATAGLSAAAAGPDFLRPLPKPTRGAWLALASAGAMLLVAALDARDAWHERERSLEANLLAERSAGGAQQAGAKANAPPGAGRRVSRDAPIEIDPSGRLQYRWDEAFLAAERASLPGIQWLAFDHAGDSGELRLEGVARDERTPARAVALLRGDIGWTQVLLARQEPKEGSGHSFEISMRRSALRAAADVSGEGAR